MQPASEGFQEGHKTDRREVIGFMRRKVHKQKQDRRGPHLHCRERRCSDTTHYLYRFVTVPKGRIKMRVCSVDARVSALVSGVLFCLAASSLCLVRAADGPWLRNEVPRSPAVPDDSTPQTCSSSTKELKLSGASRSFKIKCPDPATQHLRPVETAAPLEGKGGSKMNVTIAYAVTTATSEGEGLKCASENEAELLDTLAPGSTLAADSTSENHRAVEKGQGVSGTVFNLKLGEPQKDDKHFCYTCTATGSPGQKTDALCTILVTVPKKEASGPSDPSPDSGSFSPAVFGWSALTVTGCLLGLMLYL